VPGQAQNGYLAPKEAARSVLVNNQQAARNLNKLQVSSATMQKPKSNLPVSNVQVPLSDLNGMLHRGNMAQQFLRDALKLPNHKRLELMIA
jgi:hypothetical protein